MSSEDAIYGSDSNVKCFPNLTPTPIMHYVYILKSRKDKNLYVGYSNNLEKRIEDHNNGYVASTKRRRPFDAVYYEAYSSEQDARKREANLKLRSRAFAQLRTRIEGSNAG